jgi:hypothetical protein
MAVSQNKSSFPYQIRALTERVCRSDLAMFAFFFVWILVWLRRFLDMPYHWDSVGYVSHHTYTIYQHILLPFVTGDYDVGHPTLIFWISAVAWRIFGVSVTVSHVIIYLFASLLLLYTYKFGRLLGLGGAAFWATLMMSLVPLIASQTAQFQLDIPFAALFTAAAYYLLKGKRSWQFVAFTTALVLTKLQGVLFLGAMMIVVLGDSVYASGLQDWKAHLRRQVPFVVPILALMLFFVGRYIATGTVVAKFHSNQIAMSFSPSSLLRNARSTLNAVIFINDAYLFLALIGLSLVLFWRPGARRDGRTAPMPDSYPCRISWKRFVLYGIITFPIYTIPQVLRSLYPPLPRYFMMYIPFVCLAAGWAFLRFWRLNRVLSTGLFTILCVILLFHWHPKRAEKIPLRALKPVLVNKWVLEGDWSGETNFVWVDYVNVVERMASYMEENFPHDPSILAVFPEDAILSRPYNGYVTRPHEVRCAWTVGQSQQLFAQGDVGLCVRTLKSCMDFSMAPLVEHVPLRLVMRYERRGVWGNLYEKVEASDKNENPHGD